MTIRRLPRDVAAELHQRVYHKRFLSSNGNDIKYVKSTSHKSKHNPNTITPAQNIPIGELEESYWAKWKPHRGTEINNNPRYISVHHNMKPQIHFVSSNDRNSNTNNQPTENNKEVGGLRKPATMCENKSNEIGLVQRLREKFDNKEQTWNEVCPFCHQFRNVSSYSNQMNPLMVLKYSFGEGKVFDETQNRNGEAKFDNSVTLVSSKENFDNEQSIKCKSLEENVIEDDRCSCRSLCTQNAENKQKNVNVDEEINVKLKVDEDNAKHNEVEHYVTAAEDKMAAGKPLQTNSSDSNQNCESVPKDTSFSSDNKSICLVSEYIACPKLDSKFTENNAIESEAVNCESTADDKINDCGISQSLENKSSILRQNCNDKAERSNNLQSKISNLNNNLLSSSSVWAHSYPLKTSKKQQTKVTGHHRSASSSKSLPVRLRQPSYLRK